MNKLFAFLLFFSSVFAVAQDYEVLDRKRHDPLCVDFNRDGTLIATGGSDSKVIIWNTHDKSIKHELKGHEDLILNVKFSPDGEVLASACRDASIILWNVKTGILDKIFTGHLSAVTSVTFSPDGQLLYSACADGTIGIWDVYKNMKAGEMRGHKKEVSGVAIDKQGKTLASCSYDGSLKLWDLDRNMEKANLDLKGGRVRAIAFSPDGKNLAATTDDKSIRVVDLETHQVIQTIRGHRDLVYSIEYSKDGQYMFTGAWDGTVKVWETLTGELTHTFKDIKEYTSLSASIDGKYLAAAGMYPVANVYDVGFLNIEAVKPHAVKKVFHVSDAKVEPKHKDPNFNATPPMLNVVAPNLANKATRGGEEFILHFEKEILLKGNGQGSKNKIYEIYVNGVEVGADEHGNFEHKLKLGFGNNDVTIKTVDVYENVTEKKFVIKRQHSVIGINDTIRPSTDYALVIATNEFNHWSDLGNPMYDGQELARVLKNKYGFTVETLFNPTKREIMAKLKDYCKKQYNKDDQLMIFIAGHGDYDNDYKEGYLIPKDGKLDDEFKESYIAHSNLRNIINHIKCEHVLLTMDVCFGGSFDPFQGRGGNSMVGGVTNGAKSMVYSDAKKLQYIRDKQTADTRRFITSGGLKYVPDGTPGAHSPFAKKLLEGLSGDGGNDHIITFNELWRKVQEVGDLTLSDGTAAPAPWSGTFGNNQKGSDFLFIKK